ncbi:MAG: hypothetical protein HOW97_01140 [Catenulispora sp.]|nr:hypothetical protein [Catenulispora sp.]
MDYPVALFLTLVVEVPIYATVLIVAGLTSRRAAALLGIGVNLLTHPVVWALTGSGSLLVLAAAELGAWLVEAAVLYAVIRREAVLLFALALCANCASFLLGLALS